MGKVTLSSIKKMKTLITYFSFSGNNELLTNDIQKRLHCETFQIVESKKRKGFTILLDVLFSRTPRIQRDGKDLKQYDHIIFIAPIWAGKIATPLKSFLLLEKENIRGYSFITACSGSKAQKDKIQNELTRLAGKSPAMVTELWINDLLPAHKKNKIKYVTPYRLQPKDFAVFADKIEKHLEAISKSIVPTLINVKEQ